MAEIFDFRIRFILAPGEQLNIDSPTLNLSGHFHPSLILSTGIPGVNIKDSKNLIIRGTGHKSEEAAFENGMQIRDLLSRTFSKLHIGADFGDRAQKGGFLSAGLAMLEQQFNKKKVMNNVHGIMTFEFSPDLVFAGLGNPQITRGWNEEKFIKVFSLSCKHLEAMSEKERLSYDLFSASYFERSQDARLLTLMMSYEVLLEPQERPEEVLQHVENLISLTKNANMLPSNQKNSLLGSLRWLKNESISQAGRRLARERLGDRQYFEMNAEQFFTHCYKIRSQLIHGKYPFPTRTEVSSTAANLETFVGDILSGQLLDLTI